MHLAQIFVIALYFTELGATMALHGKPREGKYNVFFSLFTMILMFCLLLWGRFFSL